MEKITKYRNLSWPLKVAVVVAWMNLIYGIIVFGIAFLLGFLGYA